LQPLTDRDAEANNLLAAFDFGDSAAPAQQELPSSGGINILLLGVLSGTVGVALVGMLLWRRAVRQS
jgi:hypothetical protein